MKINKKNPQHWLILLLFTINTAFALLFRKFFKSQRNKYIVLYGHKLNGNLKALYDEALEEGFRFYFLTMDPAYYVELKKQNIKVLFGLKLNDVLKVGQASLVISDHGLHSLILLLKNTDIQFVDVWHGIPFKGFDSDDFIVQHQYTETWVASEYLKQLYINKFGFNESKVKALGYARTDVLVNKDCDIKALKKRIGIPEQNLHKKIILFAPTWVQDNAQRNIYPFQQSEAFFINLLEEVCQQTDSICLLRKHLNTPLQDKIQSDYVFDCSYASYPDAESMLLISDVLVCDWSSIAFDYLLLQRPTIFLDVPAPFSKGLSLDETHRFGHIVSDTDSLAKTLMQFLNQPQSYYEDYAEKAANIEAKVYQQYADGKVAKRSLKRIEELLNF